MKPARAWLILVLVLSALPVFAQQVVYVDDSCLAPPGLGTPTNPFCAIQDGMAAVNSGGTVIVR